MADCVYFLLELGVEGGLWEIMVLLFDLAMLFDEGLDGLILECYGFDECFIRLYVLGVVVV